MKKIVIRIELDLEDENVNPQVIADRVEGALSNDWVYNEKETCKVTVLDE
jgi:hypothetical protein